MPDPIILALTILWLWDIFSSMAYLAGLVFLYRLITGGNDAQ